MARRSFLINATELRIVLGSTPDTNHVHGDFEAIWRRYHPEAFTASYRHAKPTPAAVAVRSMSSSSSSSSSSLVPMLVKTRPRAHMLLSRISQRCVVSRPDSIQFSLYQRTMYDRLWMLYREQLVGGNKSGQLIQAMSRQNGTLFEAEMLDWFHRFLWPQIQQRERLIKQQSYKPLAQNEAPIEALSSLSDELDLVRDASTCDTMHHRFMGFVRAPADGLFWWLRGKVDGKLVARHHRFRTDASSSSSLSSSSPRRRRLQVIEAKLHSQLYEREAELLQLLGYLLLLDVESGYLVQSKMVCGAESGHVDVTMAATRVQSDDLIWSRWIIPRMNQLLFTIDWLSRHKMAADAYFCLDKTARNAYIDHLLDSVSVMRMPSVRRIG
jgi:hypothetical protein